MPKRRSNGEGSLHKRKNGLWECTIMVGYHDDGRRKYKSFYARTQKEVKEKVANFKQEQASGLKLDKTLTFSDWADEWYKNYEGQVSASTYDNYRYTIKLLKVKRMLSRVFVKCASNSALVIVVLKFLSSRLFLIAYAFMVFLLCGGCVFC